MEEDPPANWRNKDFTGDSRELRESEILNVPVKPIKRIKCRGEMNTNKITDCSFSPVK
ncbi:MAG: hypothetical protein K6E79_04995 [Pseudobutyrivibrio sp.]|nr:hypothetical protein [Pseudobutyrivibrio sp.]